MGVALQKNDSPEEVYTPKQKSLKLNFAMNLLLTLSGIAFPLITYPYAARVLGPEGMGTIAFVSSALSYFTLISQLGVPTYGVRECARVRDDEDALSRTVQELLVISLICTVVSYVLLVLAMVLVPQLAAEKELCVIMSSTIVLGAVGMEWLFKGLEEYVYISVRSLIFKAVALVLLFVLVRSETDYILYGAVTVFAASASNICNLIRSRKHVYFRPKEKLRLRKHLRPVLVMFALTAVTTIYTSLNSTLLGFMSTSAEVGYYDLAVKVRMILVSVVTSLGVVLLPRASYYLSNGDSDRFIALCNRAINFALRISLPIVAYVLLFASQIVAVLGGDNYEASIMLLRIISLAVILVGLSNVTGVQMLIPLERERSMLVAAIAGACTALIIDVALIPQFASLGTAVSTVIAETAVLLIQVILLRKIVDFSTFKIRLVKPLLCVMFSCAITFWLVVVDMELLLKLALSLLIFFPAYLLMLIIMRDDLTTEVVLTSLDRFHARFIR